MAKPTVTRIPIQQPRHIDPFEDGPAAPAPRPRAANPRMTTPAMLTLPGKPGGQMAWKHPGGDWRPFGEPGKAILVRMEDANPPRRAPYKPGT